jgi:hypothetical protein
MAAAFRRDGGLSYEERWCGLKEVDQDMKGLNKNAMSTLRSSAFGMIVIAHYLARALCDRLDQYEDVGFMT